jgi:carbon-monoxide dehydrogenase small subunit
MCVSRPDPKTMDEQLITLTVNGDPHSVAVSPNWTLVRLLREKLRLTGTKLGCGTGDCGACTVFLNGRPVNACLTLALEAADREIVTIEGIAPSGEELHLVQEAFVERGAVQCGFCTPGAIMTSVHLLKADPHPTETAIRHALGGNICRCTGYTKIVEAVLVAAGDKK